MVLVCGGVNQMEMQQPYIKVSKQEQISFKRVSTFLIQEQNSLTLTLRKLACNYQSCPLEDAKYRRVVLREDLKMKHPREQTHLLLVHSAHYISKNYDFWTMRFGPSLRCL